MILRTASVVLAQLITNYFNVYRCNININNGIMCVILCEQQYGEMGLKNEPPKRVVNKSSRV